jgi:membrane protease YdiL (CAAX protease family)
MNWLAATETPMLGESLPADRLYASERLTRISALPTAAMLILLVLPLPAWLFPQLGRDSQIGRECVFWVMTLALLLWVRLVEQRSLRSIGLRPPSWKTIVIGVLAAAVMIAGMAVLYLVVLPAIGEKGSAAGVSDINALPLALRILIVLRASIFEELFYRGFAIERLAELTGSRGLAAFASLVAFTLAHVSYWGIGHLMIAAFGGMVLTGLYVWRRDLAANSIAHFLTDSVAFLN